MATPHNPDLEAQSKAIITDLIFKDSDYNIVRRLCSPNFEWRPGPHLGQSLPPRDHIEDHIADWTRFKKTNPTYFAEAYNFTVNVGPGMVNAIVICMVRGRYDDRPETHRESADRMYWRRSMNDGAWECCRHSQVMRMGSFFP